MRTSRLISATFATFLSGCTAAGTRPSLPPVDPPSPPSGPPVSATHEISGLVSHHSVDGIRPLAGRVVFLWIATELRQWTETVNTDQNGRYTATVPAGSRVFASSFDAPDTEQPCLASTVVTRPVTLDVQVSSPVPYRPALTEGPLVSGYVYEMRPEGRRALEGVYVSVDGANDVWVAWTRTDRDGRFFLCRVDAPVNMVASGIEHGDSWHAIAGTGDLNLEIELKRR